MKISEYPKMDGYYVKDEEYLLGYASGINSTRIYSISGLVSAVNFNTDINNDFYNMNTIGYKNSIWSGRDIGHGLSSDQKKSIANGTFKGMGLGDSFFVEIQADNGEYLGVTWRIMGFDYWYHVATDPSTGKRIDKHHIVVMPDEVLPLPSDINNEYSFALDFQNKSAQYYKDTLLYSRSEIKTDIDAFFEYFIYKTLTDSSHILQYDDYVCTSISSDNSAMNLINAGYGIDAPSIYMLLGNNSEYYKSRWAQMNSRQLPAFIYSPALIGTLDASPYYLRDPFGIKKSGIYNSYEGIFSSADFNQAAAGFRPVIGVTG